MKSPALPKVLHGFAGRSMLGHVLAAGAPLHPEHTVVVVGHRADEVRAHLADIAPDAVAVLQAEQHGTGHAVRLALDAVPADAIGTVVVVPGDAPLLTPEALGALVDAHGENAATLLTSVLADPTGYGRVIRAADSSVERVVEHKDAGPDELAVSEVATSVYAFDHQALRAAVANLSRDNAQGEEYLPDVIGILVGAAAHRSARSPSLPTSPPASTTACNWRRRIAATTPACSMRTCAPARRSSIPRRRGSTPTSRSNPT